MRIRFAIHYGTRWGERLFAAGSIPPLGGGDPARAFPLRDRPDGWWEGEIETCAASFDYRYCVRGDDGRVEWEAAGRRFSCPAGFDAVEIRDAWRDPRDPERVLLNSAFIEVIFRRRRGRPAAPPRRKGRRIAVRLRVSAVRVPPGGALCVSGSVPALGGWDPAAAPAMNGGRFPLWTLDLSVRREEFPIRYKYVIKGDGASVVWEEGGDRTLDAPAPAVRGDGGVLILATDSGVRRAARWRGAGTAVPVFSIRTANGLGTGEFADLKPLADWAAGAGFRLIQILPVNDTTAHGDWRDSYPYNLISMFALHPLYLRVPALGGVPPRVRREAADAARRLNGAGRLDYDAVMAVKMRLAREVFRARRRAFLSSPAFRAFLDENGFWLRPYAAFRLLRDRYGTGDFLRWPDHRAPSEEEILALTDPAAPHFDEIAFHYFLQFHLHRQLRDAARYAARRGVVLKADIPIGVSRRSACAWAHPGLFRMDRSAGAPPDPFSDEGQNWGFPTFDWEAMRADGCAWWRRRLAHMARSARAARLDHVLGFFRIWEIPGHAVSGVMGRFNPAIPISLGELAAAGIRDIDRLCEPYITTGLLRDLFGGKAEWAAGRFLERTGAGRYRLRPACATQRAAAAACAPAWDAPAEAREEAERIRAGLFALVANVILLRDPGGAGFHPRINMASTHSFSFLDGGTKAALRRLYDDYFYRRQEGLWRGRGMELLGILREASGMLLCAEDLGMVPDCVPPALEELGILGLRVQRMPKEPGLEFGIPREYPYLTVCSTSTHDTSTVRGWWEENPAATARFHRDVLGHAGAPPHDCEPRIVEEIVAAHLDSPSMWAVFPIQDVLGMSGALRAPGDPGLERINVPAEPNRRWDWRMHIAVEELAARREFGERVRRMVRAAGRLEPS
ncbi:MAG: 4-alpha-glucanotransferase [bacterium]|nr:4-alpha-glucanotransferase [bacterium]